MNRLPNFLLLAFIFFACNKRRTDATDLPQGYADSQVVGSWKITAASSDVANDWDGDGKIEKDIYATWSTCQKDNLYFFAPDKTGSFKLNCSTTQPGSWEIINTKYLNYSSQVMGVESEKMIAMTAIEFKTSKAFTLSNGQAATITKTWTRQ